MYAPTDTHTLIYADTLGSILTASSESAEVARNKHGCVHGGGKRELRDEISPSGPS